MVLLLIILLTFAVNLTLLLSAVNLVFRDSDDNEIVLRPAKGYFWLGAVVLVGDCLFVLVEGVLYLTGGYDAQPTYVITVLLFVFGLYFLWPVYTRKLIADREGITVHRLLRRRRFYPWKEITLVRVRIGITRVGGRGCGDEIARGYAGKRRIFSVNSEYTEYEEFLALVRKKSVPIDHYSDRLEERRRRSQERRNERRRRAGAGGEGPVPKGKNK